MNETFYIKQGDLWPPLEANLTQATGEYIPLQPTDVVKFIMTPKNDRNTIIIDKQVTILDPTTAHVRYQWQIDDTLEAGQYQGEFAILLNGDTPIRVPNNGYFYIVIDHKLG